jgi:hypothetical protein
LQQANANTGQTLKEAQSYLLLYVLLSAQLSCTCFIIAFFRVGATYVLVSLELAAGTEISSYLAEIDEATSTGRPGTKKK